MGEDIFKEVVESIGKEKTGSIMFYAEGMTSGSSQYPRLSSIGCNAIYLSSGVIIIVIVVVVVVIALIVVFVFLLKKKKKHYSCLL